MNIVVIGGSGLVGSLVVHQLSGKARFAVSASPRSGVNTITGEGLDEAFAGADVVVDVSNSPSFADQDVLDFFTTSTRNQLAAERKAGVGHHVLLSIVGADLLPDSGYMRAKVAQEELVRESGAPFSIVRATQFFEFGRTIGEAATTDGVTTVSTGIMAPIAAADAALAVVAAVDAAPTNGTTDVGGPERMSQEEFIRRAFAADSVANEVIGDPSAPYFGALVSGGQLATGPGAVSYPTTFDEWVAGSAWQAAR